MFNLNFTICHKGLKDFLMEKHFKQIDAAKYAQEGTLPEIVQREFGEEE